MSFLSAMFDFMFSVTSTSGLGAKEEVLESGMHSTEITANNPANGMPMIGGVGGIDVRGNVWGQSDILSDEGSCSSIDYATSLVDSGSMFETDSMLDNCSIFD